MHNIPGKGVYWLAVTLSMAFAKIIIVENIISIGV